MYLKTVCPGENIYRVASSDSIAKGCLLGPDAPACYCTGECAVGPCGIPHLRKEVPTVSQEDVARPEVRYSGDTHGWLKSVQNACHSGVSSWSKRWGLERVRNWGPRRCLVCCVNQGGSEW